MPYCKKKEIKMREKVNGREKEENMHTEREKARVYCHGVAMYSSWEIWSLRCDHCRDRQCAGEMAEVA